MNTLGTGFTDIGLLRKTNEDAFSMDHDLGLFIVSDGMGGHAAGDVASCEAVKAVREYVRGQRVLLEGMRSGTVSQALLSSIARIAVARACQRVYEKAQKHPEMSGMGCTLTVLLIGRDHAAMAHVGDSRLYLHRDGELTQLSVDHTVAEEFARRGLISRAQMWLMPQGQALSRSVGVRPYVEVDELLFHIQPGDRFILCSDGVWGYLKRLDQMDRFLTSIEFENIAETLVRYSLASGGHDNSTAVAIEMSASDARVAGEPRTAASVTLVGDCSGSHRIQA